MGLTRTICWTISLEYSLESGSHHWFCFSQNSSLAHSTVRRLPRLHPHWWLTVDGSTLLLIQHRQLHLLWDDWHGSGVPGRQAFQSPSPCVPGLTSLHPLSSFVSPRFMGAGLICMPCLRLNTQSTCKQFHFGFTSVLTTSQFPDSNWSLRTLQPEILNVNFSVRICYFFLVNLVTQSLNLYFLNFLCLF